MVLQYRWKSVKKSAVAEVYPDEIFPNQYQYAMADDYFGSRFDAGETDDGFYCGPWRW